MNRELVSGLGLAAFILAGCTTVYEGEYDFRNGWSEAKIVKIAGASEIKTPQFSDCRDFATSQQLATGLFAVLSYKHMGRPHTHVAFLKPGEAFRPGDLVYVKVASCDTPLVLRGQQVVK